MSSEPKNITDGNKSDATTLKEKISTTLVIQQSNNIVSSVTENLLSNTLFQNAVTSKIVTRLSDLENRTRYISVDNFGKTIINSDVKIIGEMWGYNFTLLEKKK